MTTRTILIMAGGTGGHVFPGLAVARAMRDRDWRVVWLGNPSGMEASLVPAQGFTMEAVNFGGLRGKSFMTKLLLPLNLLRACIQSIGVLLRVKPHVVLGLGGYITFPAGLMAVLLKKPLVLHEQNSIAGLANRVLAKLARRVLVAFPDAFANAKTGLKHAPQWVGNPVRQEIASLPDPAQRFNGRSGPLQIFVVGGSLGARVLNDVLPVALAQLPKEGRPQVLHQAGKGNALAVQTAYANTGTTAQVFDFIDDMAGAYANADLVIARAGAMTVSELAAAGVASVLIPLPHAVDDHQTTNARFLQQVGAAILLPQSALNAQSLAQTLQSMQRQQLSDMAKQARALAKPNATMDVVSVCENVCESTNQSINKNVDQNVNKRGGQ